MKNTVLLLFLIAVMTVSACNAIPGQSGDSSSSSIGNAFVGGTDAVTMRFLENLPPREVFDGGKAPFNAVVLVENVGEADIDEGDLSLTLKGFYPKDFGTEPEHLSKSADKISGVKKDTAGNRIQGGLDQVQFPTNSETAQFNYKTSLAGDQEFIFIAEACYPYKTTSLSQVCTKEDFTKTEYTVCNPSGARSVENSGAPVHVSSVTQSVAGRDSTILNFKFRKVGNVQIFNKADENPCDSSDFNKIDRIHVTLGDLPETSMECFGLVDGTGHEGTLILSNGEGSLSCTMETTPVDSLKTFTVTLSYYVKDSIRQNVRVKHLLTGSGS